MCNNMFGSGPNVSSKQPAAGIPENPLNRLCRSLDEPANQQAFLGNEDEYCLRFGLTRQQRLAVKSRDYLRMMDAGGHLLHLDRLAALLKQTSLEAAASGQGVSMEMFISRLLCIGGRRP